MTLSPSYTSCDVTRFFNNRNLFPLSFSTSNLVVVVVTLLANALIPIVGNSCDSGTQLDIYQLLQEPL